MDKKHESRPGHAGLDAKTGGDKSERHTRTRRRLLQSLTVGGAAVTVKALPEKWTRPVANAVVLPAHAQATLLCTLTCEVDAVGAQSVTGGNTDVNPSPGLPYTGINGGGTIDLISNRDRVFFDGITATVGGPGCGQPSLALNLNSADTRFGPATGGNPSGFDAGTGVATFNEVSVAIDPALGFPGSDSPTTVNASLTMTFTAAGAAPCVIPISFVEDDTFPDPGDPGP